MRIKQIKLVNYRNYETLDVDFSPGRNIIIGDNAQGKTNLIKAIYLCAFARSFRASHTREMIRFGEESASITAQIISEDIDKEIKIIFHKDGKKRIEKDHQYVRRTADLLRNFVVVSFTPEDLRIIKDSPDRRRNFINKEISQLQPSYFEALRRYHEVLREKSALIRRIQQQGETCYPEDSAMLDVYDEQLSRYGQIVIRSRNAFIGKLSKAAGRLQRKISGEKEQLQIVYRKSAEEDNLQEAIRQYREKDIRLGICGCGPQRDDIQFLINGRDARKYASQGQQRTVALVLKLAEMDIAREETGENAVLLLDDVLSELDEERQRYLLQEIRDVQIFITSTGNYQDMVSLTKNGYVFSIQHGKLERLENTGV